MTVFHPAGDRPSPCGKLPISSPGVPTKILNHPEYIHVAVRGRKDSQANSNADREVVARCFARAVNLKSRHIFVRQRRSCAYAQSGGNVQRISRCFDDGELQQSIQEDRWQLYLS